MINCKVFFQLMVTVYKEKPKSYSYALYYAVALGLYLKQHIFQNKMQRTGLEPCYRIVTNLSPS